MRVSYGTYLRLDVTVHDGWRAVVRAAARKLSQKVRRDVSKPDRHRYYRQMLDDHREAHAIVSYWRL